MALKGVGLASLIIKAVLLLLIILIISLGAIATFNSEGYKLYKEYKKMRDSEGPDKYKIYLTLAECFVALSVISFLLCLASTIPNCAASGENKGVFMAVDIVLSAFAALLLLIGGALMLFAAAGECHTKGTPEGGDMLMGDMRRFNGGGMRSHPDCDDSMRYQDCLIKECRKMFSSTLKMAAGALAVVIAILGFIAPCVLAVKGNKKEPQNAVNVMGGYGGQPGGAYGGVGMGSPEYPMYVAPPPPENQSQYVYTFQPPAPQMSPSQNPAVAYPPPQGGQS